MKKGLTITLLAVVVGWVGAQANAMVPVVASMPDYIVGNADQVTGVTGFVYQDAIELDAYVNDPDGSDDDILWSFDGAGRYIFNGIQPLDSGDPLAPGAKDIASESNLNDVDLDSNARTVTIRDQIYSPLTGTGETPSGDGIVASEVVTLYASDGSTYAQTEIMVYSRNNGLDATSPEGPPVDVRTTSELQSGFDQVDVLGAVMSSDPDDGLCMTVEDSGVFFGTWASGLGASNGGEDLVANKVYRIRLFVSSDQTTSMKVPLADFVVENVDPGVAGDFAYASDFWFHDNVGSANAIKGPAVGREFFEVWFAPPAVGTAQWNDASTGAFTAGHDANNDMRFRWRTLDNDGAYGGANDSGTICLSEIRIQRFDLSALAPVSGGQVFNVTDFENADITYYDVVTGGGAVETDFTFGSNGELIMTPDNAAGWDVQIATVVPGDNVWNPTADTGLLTNFPIVWEDETLYQTILQVRASGSAGGAGETDGHDAIRISVDNPGFEIISENYMTTGLDRAGAPKATVADYMAFHHGNSESLSSVENHHRLRTRFDALSTTGYNRPEGNTNNTGGIEFHGWTVRKVTFPGWNVNN